MITPSVSQQLIKQPSQLVDTHTQSHIKHIHGKHNGNIAQITWASHNHTQNTPNKHTNNTCQKHNGAMETAQVTYLATAHTHVTHT